MGSWRAALIDALKAISSKNFELFCRRLVKQMGVEIDAKIGIQFVAGGSLDGFGYIMLDEFRTDKSNYPSGEDGMQCIFS